MSRPKFPRDVSRAAREALRVIADSTPPPRSSRMADSKPGTVADQDLGKHGSKQSAPPAPDYSPSKDGHVPDSLLSHIPPVKREF
jgi:hypothetical protein